ncbi:ATP-binding protein [Emticicia sp. BO119]|uniref:ATP-binding protein n=1 Tax=Emticicia sp. BO119 TaxID=2757768 RepID=UPI0015F10221|nr:ATP-binding protein [Emticicia sp. BO119]MBA4849058.1 type IV pili methyl-accepting chemotaxis transducer N-terminal domain-containing protein [Emticicia sp. BO119]
MPTLEQQVTQRLTRLYILALTAVAVLSISGQVLIQESLEDSLNDAHVVNIAGRQRMLSQRLSKVAILLTNTDRFSEEARFYQKDFGETLALWSKCHEGLLNGKLEVEREVAVKNSSKIKLMLNELNPIFLRIKSNLNLILTNKATDKKQVLNVILANERLFLNQMDRIVFQYDLESHERVNRVRSIELFLFLLTIAILLLEGLLIFKPLAIYIKEVISRLINSEEALQERNQELSISNQKLIEIQKDLVKITEEKYELVRKEDNVRSSALMEGQEEERRRLSRELHDGIGQMLTGLKLHSEKLKSLPFADDKQRKTFETHSKLIEETIEATRMVSFNLMPPILTDFGLGAAIRLLTEYTTQTSDIQVSFESNYGQTRLNSNLEVNLYRIAQEALNNIIKHSKATEATVVLKKNKSEIELTISDNGVGFEGKGMKKETSINNGLPNMQTRVRLLGGHIHIQAKSTKGTRITVKIPN